MSVTYGSHETRSIVKNRPAHMITLHVSADADCVLVIPPDRAVQDPHLQVATKNRALCKILLDNGEVESLNSWAQRIFEEYTSGPIAYSAYESQTDQVANDVKHVLDVYIKDVYVSLLFATSLRLPDLLTLEDATDEVVTLKQGRTMTRDQWASEVFQTYAQGEQS